MKTLLKIDTFFQTLLFYVTLSMGAISLIMWEETILAFGCGLFFLGAWQLVSGFVFSIILKDSNRWKYFLGSTGYVLLLITVSDFINKKDSLEILLAIVFIAIIPMAIAFWYLGLANKTLKEWDTERGKFTENEMEHILDSEEVLGI